MKEMNEERIREEDEARIRGERGMSEGKVCYGKRDWYLALFLLLGAWFYVRGDSLILGLGQPAFILIYLAAGNYYRLGKGRRMSREEKTCVFFLAAAALWSFLGLLPENRIWIRQPIGPYDVLFAHCAGVYWVLSLGGEPNKRLS